MFFEMEEKKGGGRVKNIDIDSIKKCAFVAFENQSGIIS